MKYKIFGIILFLSHYSYAQSEKDLLLKRDLIELVEKIKFMYSYDQTLRECTIYKTFDNSTVDRIKNLPDSLRSIEMNSRNFQSDNIGKLILKKIH
jgi:hypothetical protein